MKNENSLREPLSAIFLEVLIVLVAIFLGAPSIIIGILTMIVIVSFLPYSGRITKIILKNARENSGHATTQIKLINSVAKQKTEIAQEKNQPRELRGNQKKFYQRKKIK